MLLLNLRRRSTRALLASALVLQVASPALAETIYRYQTADGSWAYADDLKRVPERFRGDAKAFATGSLSTYSRYTPTDPEAARVQQAQTAQRLGYLRELNAALSQHEAVAAMAPAAPGKNAPLVRLGSDDGSPVYVPAAESDEGPIVVEEKRYRVAGSFVTRHDTIVRRGDKILAIYKPRPHVVGTTSTLDIQDESVLERR
jgi:hypothetical protein